MTKLASYWHTCCDTSVVIYDRRVFIRLAADLLRTYIRLTTDLSRSLGPSKEKKIVAVVVDYLRTCPHVGTFSFKRCLEIFFKLDHLKHIYFVILELGCCYALMSMQYFWGT